MQFKTQNGSRVVISNNQNSCEVWESRLYVSFGESVTNISAKHKSIKAAQKWANKQVGK